MMSVGGKVRVVRASGDTVAVCTVTKVKRDYIEANGLRFHVKSLEYDKGRPGWFLLRMRKVANEVFCAC